MVISSWYYPSKENVTLDMVVFVLCFNVIFMGMMDIKHLTIMLSFQLLLKTTFMQFFWPF